MTECPHCHGTGQQFAPRGAQPGPLRKMIPFGRETQAALSSRVLQTAPWLAVATCPQNGKDRWELAREWIAQRGRGSAMVLPEGDDVRNYRFPAITVCDGYGVQLVAWAFDWPSDQAHALGHALIDAGIDAVHVLCSVVGPLEFRAR